MKPNYFIIKQFHSNSFLLNGKIINKNKTLLQSLPSPKNIDEPHTANPSSFNQITQYFKKAKQTASQYLSGSKLLFANIKQTSQLKQILKNKERILTRSEFILIRQTDSDIFKMIPFFIIFGLVPELLPFIILKFPDFIPSTCRNSSDLVFEK